MWIVRLALKRTYTFVVVALLIAVLGAVSIYRLSTDIFPNIDIPIVSVVWQYTGMPTDEVESRIVLLNERILTASVNDIEHIESQSLSGVGVIRIYFRPGANVAEAEAQVTATCQTLLKLMPPGITPPYIVRYSATSVPILQIAVSSDTLTEQEILDYCANFVIQQLGTVQGARVPQPWGGKQRQIMVYLDPDAMYSYGLSPADVSTAIGNQNLIIPAGTAKMGTQEYNVKINSSPAVIDAFNYMPIRTVNGIPIFVKDVAHVADGYAVQTNAVRRDGRRAVLMTILKGEGASTISVVNQVRAALPTIQNQLPPELKMEPLFDQSVFVRAAVDGVLKEGAVAAGLTALMILLFLGSWRSTLIVATSIPLSILCSIIILWALGHSLNTMTLGGMALAVGILVDDATVEIENVHRNMAMKKPLRRAILDGAAQIATPAFVSTLAICIVFVPVVFLTGPAAYLFTPLALAVVFAMLASYFLSRTLVPTMVLYLLPKEAEAESRSADGKESPRFTVWSGIRHPSLIHDAFNRGFERLRLTYHGLLEWGLDHRFVTVAVLLGFALGSLLLYSQIGQDFFPSVDAGQFRLHVRAPAGTRIEETERIFGNVENAIREVVPKSELDMILDNFGLTQSFTIMAYIDNGTVSDGDGEILVSLKPNHGPTANYVARLRDELPRRFPGCTFFFEPADITSQILDFGLPAPIDVQVVGVNREANLAVAQKLRQEIAKVRGIADVHLNQMTDMPDLRLNVDRIMASELGLTQQDVAGSVLVSLSSTTQVSPNFWVNPTNRVNYRVAVQTPDYAIHSVDTLMNTPIIKAQTSSQPPSAPGGTPTNKEPPAQLLANLADVDRGMEAANINHYNVQPVYNVYANVQGGDLGNVSADVQKIVEAFRPKLPRGSSIVIRGQVESMNSSFLGLATGLVFAVLLVYLLMVVNFQSWLDPLIILTALPGAVAGILWMLFATGTTISVPALMGAIMCIGVATSNSILMVTFANDQRRGERGGVSAPMDARGAALSAGATRLRPVLMTALAMIIGMLPMSLGLGEGGEQNAPLGRAVIGGLLMATCYTLFFVPVMYSLLRHRPPAPEPVDDDGAAEPTKTHSPLATGEVQS